MPGNLNTATLSQDGNVIEEGVAGLMAKDPLSMPISHGSSIRGNEEGIPGCTKAPKLTSWKRMCYKEQAIIGASLPHSLDTV